jgi:hypothetical protein
MVDNSLMRIFIDKIKGKQLPPMSHDGAIGHWLETQFGVSANNDDAADWFGYELKQVNQKLHLVIGLQIGTCGKLRIQEFHPATSFYRFLVPNLGQIDQVDIHGLEGYFQK